MRKFGLMIALLWIGLLPVSAQTQIPINYGDVVSGTLNNGAPVVIYSFAGTAGDQVTIQAISLDADLELKATLQNGSDVITSREDDPFTVGSNDVRMDLRLPDTNTYILLISNVNGQSGDFVVKLSQHTTTDAIDIVDPITDLQINAGAISTYHIDEALASSMYLTLDGTDSELEFHALIYGQDGTVIYTATGTLASVLLPEDQAIDIALKAVDPLAEGNINLSVQSEELTPEATATATATPTQTETPSPTATPSATATPMTPSPTPTVLTAEPTEFDINDFSVCKAFSGGFPNIRAEPSTSSATLTQIQPGSLYVVVGMYTNWLQIIVPNIGAGWVRDDVVALGGDCTTIANVSEDNMPIIPTNTPTMTYTPSVTPVILPTATMTYTPTATYTPSVTPIPTETDTPTPTVFIEIAPVDTEFNSPLNVPLDNTVSVLNFVSYPNGDTVDQVRWDVTGMNEDADLSGGRAQLTITATCFGNGVEFVEFTIGTDVYACGDILFDQEVTADSKTGLIEIRAIDGNDAYVQWVLTGTATRLD